MAVYRLVFVLEFPTTDGEDTFEQVKTIVNCLYKSGRIKEGDKVSYKEQDCVIRIYIYRCRKNGEADGS